MMASSSVSKTLLRMGSTRAGAGRVDAAVKHAVARCPFLKHNPEAVDSLAPISSAPIGKDSMRFLAGKCPVMAPVIHSPASKLASGGTILDTLISESNKELMQDDAAKQKLMGKQVQAEGCPSLLQPPQCPVTNAVQYPDAAMCPFAHKSSEAKNNAIPVAKKQEKYNYDKRFSEMIVRKKNDASYRIFNTVKRDAAQYPKAAFFQKANGYDPCPNSPISSNSTSVEVWCSNDYLGMSRHPEVVNTICDTVRREGVGSGGTRNISGNGWQHENIEKELARLHNKEAALLFGSCFVANDAALSTFGNVLPDCIYYSDADNHASMIQGIRNSRCEKRIFRHNDFQHLDHLMSMDDPSVPKIVAFESVYSMCGTIAPIKELCDVARKHNALTFIDEVHAVGLYGDTGAGVAERDHLMDAVDIVTGTLAKAYGTIGGYVAGPKDLIDTVRSYAPGFVFSSSLPPMLVAGAAASVNVLKGSEGQELRRLHQTHAHTLIRMLEEVGIPTLPTQSHIVPVAVGDARICKSISDTLLAEHNIYVQSINFPTVPRGTERLRVTPGPFHTEEMMVRFVDALTQVWKEHELDFLPPPPTTKSVRDERNCTSATL